MDIGDGECILILIEILNCVLKDKWCNIEIKYLCDVDSWIKDVKVVV